MRIAWATLFNERTAIAQHAYDVTIELKKRGLNVEIVRTETGEAASLPPYSTDIPVWEPGNINLDKLRSEFDLVLVTLADHFGFNRGSMEILKCIPAVGIFHDSNLDNLLKDMVHFGSLDKQALDLFRQIGVDVPVGTLPVGRDLAWLATLCIGAVAHSPHYTAPLKFGCPGPTLNLPLCFQDPGRHRSRENSDGTFTIVTFGFLNANKQMDRVMRALARSEVLRERFKYELVGSISDQERERLTALAMELEITAPHFHGWLPDRELQDVLCRANAVCCLRYPILEGGSASLVFSLYSENPVITVDEAAYAEVPDALVWKVSYGVDPDDVTRALEEIATNQAAADARAAEAAIWARRTHSASAYVDKLLPFLETCLSISSLVEAGRIIGSQLEYCGAALDDPAHERIGRVMQDLFD